MLTASELAAMRTTITASLAGTAIIKTQTRTSDGRGGGTTAWTAAGTASCRVTPATAGEGVQGGRVQPDTEYIFTFTFDTAIDNDAQIVYESRNFTVTGCREPRTWELSRRVEAKEVG